MATGGGWCLANVTTVSSVFFLSFPFCVSLCLFFFIRKAILSVSLLIPTFFSHLFPIIRPLIHTHTHWFKLFISHAVLSIFWHFCQGYRNYIWWHSEDAFLSLSLSSSFLLFLLGTFSYQFFSFSCSPHPPPVRWFPWNTVTHFLPYLILLCPHTDFSHPGDHISQLRKVNCNVPRKSVRSAKSFAFVEGKTWNRYN